MKIPPARKLHNTYSTTTTWYQMRPSSFLDQGNDFVSDAFLLVARLGILVSISMHSDGCSEFSVSEVSIRLLTLSWAASLYALWIGSRIVLTDVVF
jgi:hypothetical protein